MASIDRVMALAEEIKKKKKDPNYQINQSMVNVNDLATDIKSGNRGTLQNFIEGDRGMFDAPIKSLTEDKEERSWFKKGLFNDGYDFGDVTKTILGTATDISQDFVKGALNIGESTIDTGAYLVGGASKLLGNDKFADKTRKFIEKDIINEDKISNYILSATSPVASVNNLLNKNFDSMNMFDIEAASSGRGIESNSVLGDKSDSLVQSGGQLAGTIGLQALGVPWWVTTGTTSFGREVESALKQDATYGEAGFSGLVSAGAEILTEKLSGGISFGSKTADDLWKKPLMDKISNKTIQTLTKFGIDVVGEGTEEVLTEIISNLGKKLSYEDEKTWNEMFLSEEAMDNYLEAFIGGAVLGGGFNLGRVTSSIKTGRDYDTNLTENEQVVIDIETNNRIEEQEKDGNKLSNKEKAEIQQQVMNDLEKGYISTDTIESTLGGDTYNQLKSIRDNQTNIQNQIAELENKANAEITVKEMERLQSLREELSQTDTKTLESQLQSEMGQNIKSDAYLQRSYQEKANRSVQFEADLSKYDAKQQAVVQKAIDSGILNNTNRTHDFVDMVAKISSDKGIDFDFTNNENLKNSGFAVEGKTVNGYIQDGNIAVNIDSPKALNRVVGHEITHVLEGTPFYTELQNAVKQYATTKGEYDTRLADLTNLYKNVKGANVENELTADLVGDYLFTDPDFINNLSTEKPSLFKKVYNEIKHLYNMATAGSKEARELLKVKKAFEKAYKENVASRETNNETSVSETTTEATSQVDSLGRELSAEQIAFFEDSKVRDAEGNLLVMYHGTRADFNTFDMNRAGQNYEGDWSAFGRGFYFTPNKEAANEFSSAAIEGNNKNVKEVYLNITNPFYTENSYSDTLSNLKERYNLDTLDKGYKVIEALNKNGYDSTEVLKELGYDGVIDNYDGKIEEAVAFKGNQIKDVDNKKPTLSEDIRYSLSEADLKQQQLGIVLENNPVQDDYHTWIRSIDDIKTYEETLNDPEWSDYVEEGFDPDYTGDMVKEAVETGKITVYSSYPIEQGIFVSPSRMEAESYSSNGKVYSKEVNLTDVAWIDPTQGQYAKVDSTNLSLSNPNEQTAPSRNDVFGEDVRLDLAPLQEEIQALTETITELRNNMENAITNAIPDGASVIDMGRANTIDDLPMLDQQRDDSFNTLEEPTVMEEEVIPEYEGNTNVESPFDNRDIDEVGKRSVKAYQYENPEVRPYFQQEARAMLEELNDSIKGERYIIGDTSQNAYGDYEYSGTKRMTSPDIEYLLDNFNYTYADIEKGLRAIIEDHGAENIAVAKRIEFILDERLRNGYDTFGTMSIYEPHVEPNQAYINLLQGMEQAEQYSNAPIGEAPYVEDASNTEEIAPVREQSEAIKPNRAAFNEAVRESARVVERDLGYVPQNPTQESTYDEIAEILTEEPTTANERNQRKLAIIAANVLDKGLVFENVSLKNKNRELMGKWDYTLTSEARAQTAIGQGHYDNETGETISKSLNEIMEEVNNTGLTKQFYEYIYHKHNVDRMQLADKFEDMENKPVFGFDVTAEDSQEIVNQYEFSNPEFIDFAQDVYDYVNADRKLLVDNGVISQETADLWNKMYPHYVPIRREGHTGNAINVPLDTGRTGINAPIKKATGGSSNILPLFDTMAMRTLQTYRATSKNSFGVELMKTLGTKIESTTTNVDEVIDSVDAQESLLQENNGKPTFTVFENGEKITFSITKDMYDALKPLSDSSILSKTIKPLNVASSFHRGLLTQYNPVFALTNGIKDMQDILLNSQHAAKTYSKIPEAYAQVLKKGYWYQEYMANGGENNSYFDSQDNTFQTENKGIKKLLDLPPLKQIAQMNDFIEIIPRLSEYIASREMGRSIEVSMLDAARVTTNFKAGGNLTKFLNRNGATFLNASVQGAMQQVRNVREAKANGIRGWANLATKFTIAGLPAILLNALLWEDDEEYEELSDYVKQNYYVVAKTDDGKFIRIPKGRTVAVIQDAVEQMKNFTTGDDEVDLASFIELFLTNLAPSNPIDNNVFAPIIQAVNNQTWYGEDLVPTRLQDLPAAEQYDESTDSFSKWLGGVLNISPVKINYLLDQYSGGVGDVVLPMLTPEAESGDDSFLGNMIAPLKSKFTTDAVMNNQNVSDFYSKSEELTTNAKKSNATDEDVLKNKYINSVKAEMNELYKEKREIQNSDLSSSEKYNQVREIQGQINELSKNALNSYEDIDIQGNYSSVGDREYHKDTKNEWKAINSDEAAALNSMGMSSYDKDNYFSAKNQITNVVKNYKNEKENMDTEDEEYEGEVSLLSGEKKVSIINAIKNAGLNDEQMAYLYDKYYASTEKLNTVVKTGIGMNAYLDLESQNFTSDVNAKGKTISGSKKRKVFDYINSMDIGFEQRVILAKMYYPSYDEYNYDIIDYLNNDDSISFSDMKEILETLDFKVYEDGTIEWD
jgi:hypothetical protein